MVVGGGDGGGGGPGAASTMQTGFDRMASVVQTLEAGLQRGEAVRAQARRQEMEDELQIIRLRGEQHASQQQMMDKMLQTLHEQPQRTAAALVAARNPVVDARQQVLDARHQVVDARQQAMVDARSVDARSVTVNHYHQLAMHNLQQNFTRMGDHVQNVHNQTMNHLTVNAPRVIQVAARFGTSIMDAYSNVSKKRPPVAGEPLAITNAPGPPPPPPPPDAARVKRAALAIADRPVRPSDPPAPAPLEPPTTPAPKRQLALTDIEREQPTGPMDGKKKPRALAIEDRKVEKKVERVEKREKEGKRAKPAYGFVPAVRRSIQKREKSRRQPDEEPEPDPEVLPARAKKTRVGTRPRVRIVKVA